MDSPISDPDDGLSETRRPEHLTDNRSVGDWRSRYPTVAWWWIVGELLYLVIGMNLSLAFLYQLAVEAHPSNGSTLWPLGLHFSLSTLALGAIGVGGASGGFAFALKWHYHGVAYGKWHRDRLIWRLIVPLLSGVLALFTALMIGSGFIPIFSAKITEVPRIGAAYGFFVGFFSDNMLAALQRLADQTLGTLGRVEERQTRQPKR